MALRSWLIMDPNEVLSIIDNISDSDRCSGEDNSASNDDIISPMSEHEMRESEATVSDDDTFRNHLDFYTCD